MTGSVDENSGHLVLSPAANTVGSTVGVVSPARYRLSNSSLAAELVPTQTAGVETVFQMEFNSLDRIGFVVRDGQLRMFYTNAVVGLVDDVVSYDPLEHRWLRLLHDGDSLLWQTSPDGADWTPAKNVAPVPIDLESLDVWLFATTPSPVASPDSSFVEQLGEP